MGTERVLPDWLSGQRFYVTVRKFELTKSLVIFKFFLLFCFNLSFLRGIGMEESFFSVSVDLVSPYPFFLHSFSPSSISFPPLQDLSPKLMLL